jgi:tetratricopeptide (TPR) repeat protein
MDTQESTYKSFSPEKFNRTIAVLIAVVTLITAIIAYLQSDAAARDDRANRDTKRYSIEAFGRKVSGDARVNYDYNTAYQNWYELNLLADSARNRGDDEAAARYEALRDNTIQLSPLLQPPYFDAAAGGEPDIARYEADTYIVEITELRENFTAASAVKDAWDNKANTYIVHITLLAVCLFLFGLSTTISGQQTRWIFAGVGSVIAVIAVIWAVVLYTQPVKDQRDTGAIRSYAQAEGLAHQEKWEEAIELYDQAIAAAPDYANAYLGRADAAGSLGNIEAAVTDFEAAIARGDKTASTAGNLAWHYYLLGRFDDAIRLNQIALQSAPDELWIRYDLGLAQLASGNFDAARATYDLGMQSAARQVADAKAAGSEPPSYLWWGLDDAALQLDYLMQTLDGADGAPSADQIAQPDAVYEAAGELFTRIKNQSVSLEYTGEPSTGELSAVITPLKFAEPVYDDQGEVQTYNEGDAFDFGANEISILFDYEGMQDGQNVLFKVYIDGEEDPSWRLIAPWELGKTGSAEKSLSLSYSDNFVLSPGDYVVELYIDEHLAQRGGFVINPEG